jgi:hypothetical protein
MTAVLQEVTAVPLPKSGPGRKPGGKNQNPGLCAKAKALKVTPTYLWKFLSGRVQSGRLAKKLSELEKRQNAATPANDTRTL